MEDVTGQPGGGNQTKAASPLNNHHVSLEVFNSFLSGSVDWNSTMNFPLYSFFWIYRKTFTIVSIS